MDDNVYHHTSDAGMEVFLFRVSETQEKITVGHIYLCKSGCILEILNNIHYMKKIKARKFVYTCVCLTIEGEKKLCKGQTLIQLWPPDT